MGSLLAIPVLRRYRHGVWRTLPFKETHFKGTAPTSWSCEDAGMEVPLITSMASKLKSTDSHGTMKACLVRDLGHLFFCCQSSWSLLAFLYNIEIATG